MFIGAINRLLRREVWRISEFRDILSTATNSLTWIFFSKKCSSFL